MDDAGPEDTEAAALAEGYEQLRERVLSGQPDGWQLGRAVLASKGTAAWIGAWATLVPPAPQAGISAPDPSTPTSPSTSSTDPSALSSLPNAGQLVAVLTQMALAHA